MGLGRHGGCTPATRGCVEDMEEGTGRGGGGKVGGWGSGREASSNERFTESLLSCFRMGKQEQGGGGLSRSPLELTTGRKHWMNIGRLIRYLFHSEEPVSSGVLLFLAQINSNHLF